MLRGAEFVSKYGNKSTGGIRIRTPEPGTKVLTKNTVTTKKQTPQLLLQHDRNYDHDDDDRDFHTRYDDDDDDDDDGFKDANTFGGRPVRDPDMDLILRDMCDALEAEQLPLWNTMSDGDRLVFGEGTLNSGVMVIGEAPGSHEAESGRPFVGDSGKLVEALFREYGLELKSDTFVTNIVKLFPYTTRKTQRGYVRIPRPPTMDEIAPYVAYLARQIARIRPKLIYCFGKISSNILLVALDFMKLSKNKTPGRLDCDLFVPMGKLQSAGPKIVRLEGVGHQTWVVPLFHPSFILRQEPHQQLDTQIQWKAAFALGLSHMKSKPIAIPEGFHSSELYTGDYKCPDNVNWRKPSDIFWKRPTPNKDYFKKDLEKVANFSLEMTGLTYNTSTDIITT